MNKNRRKTTVTLALIACWLHGFAQIAPGQLRFDHITVNEGLSHSDAMAVVQDRQGFIWVGTNNGVDRYDGYQIKPYFLPVDNLDGLSNNRVRALHVSRTGTIWVGTEGGGISFFQPDQDRFLQPNEEKLSPTDQANYQRIVRSEVTALSTDTHGNVWIGTRQQGLFRVTIQADGNLQAVVPIKLGSMPSDQVEITELLSDSSGTIWIATLDRGLYYVRGSEIRPFAKLALPLDHYQVLALTIDRQGDLWIGTANQVLWVSKQDLANSRVDHVYKLPYMFRSVGCLYRDSFDRLWVGTDFGLAIVPVQTPGYQPPRLTGKVTTFLPQDDDPRGINSGRIHALLEDQSQVMWLAVSADGLNKVDLRQKSFGHLYRQPNQHPTLPNNYINAIYKEEKRGLLWIATRNGFTSYDLARKSYRNFLSNALPGNVTGIDVSCIKQATDSTLWLGTRYDGLYALRRKQGRDELTTYPLESGPFRHLESIAEDRFGTLWLATFYNGLVRIDRNGHVLATYTPANSTLPTSRFTFLLYDKATDVLWASTQDAGVLKLEVRAKHFNLLAQYAHTARDTNSLRVNYAWPLLRDRKGTIWVGTIGGGLHQIIPGRNGRDQVRSCVGWLPDSNVESLLEDQQENIWCGGAGLIKINPRTHQVFRYDIVDGVQSNSFKVGAAYRAADGMLYFGGVNGITYFQPRQIQPNPYPPLVRLTGIALANKSIAVGETVGGRVLIQKPLDQQQVIQIRSSENDFSISFVGLNFANPQKHHYAYRLVGYNDGWVQPVFGQRTASFANLPAGDYTFMVKADNGEGRWCVQPATLQIRVLPPWWKTWWAYGLYALFIGTGLWLARRILVNQQALKNKAALEHFQYEKEKELTELKLRFFTNVSHELRTPLTLILGPVEELVGSATKFNNELKDKIVLVHQQTRRLLSLVNQLLDFRRVESAVIPLRATEQDIMAFLTELFLMFRLKAQEEGIHLSLQSPHPGEPIVMFFDRSKLEIVLINLLANALKYTPAGRRITLQVETIGNPDQATCYVAGKFADHYLQISVCDEGKGMAAHETDRIFDLYYQASQTDSLRLNGSGIGLSLAKQFIERQGGNIHVQSQLAIGTTFTIKLPFGSTHLAPEDLVSDTALITNETAGADIAATHVKDTLTTHVPARRLLIVEDNEEVRQYLVNLFMEGFDVSTANDGRDGWEQVQHLIPDLVISDIMMPFRDGLDLCRLIKQHPKTLHIPVVLLTARVATAHELEGLETGADDYIAKPFNPSLLTARVSMLLNNRLKLRQYYQQNLLLQPNDIVIPDADRIFLEKAMSLVEANLTKADFSAQWLIREMGMSRSVFFRRLKSITGQSVIEFINDVRMKRAAQLLSTGQLRVSEVCEMVGLEDLKHFRKAFQQLHGLSPSEYGKQHQSDATTA